MFQLEYVPFLNNQTYGHGSFMGSAPEFVNSTIWMNVLRLLMPDVYTSIVNSDEIKLIKQMENNPIMAAFGVYETYKINLVNLIRTNIKTLEIDVYLPSQLMVQFSTTNSPVLKKLIATSLVNELLVAHGTGLQIAAENLGISQYQSIIENDVTNLGGVKLPMYFSLFSKAIRLVNMYDRIQYPSQQNINNILMESTSESSSKASELFKLYTNNPLSILLDIKSTSVTSEMIKYMIPEFNKLGIIVSHVASFKFKQIISINQQQSVNGIQYGSPISVKFFHMSGDVQYACKTRTLVLNDTISFNIGSLIEYDRNARSEAKKRSYKINWFTLEQLKGFKQYYNLHIFGYVQEFDIDESAVKLLIDLVNLRTDIFDLGFAFGNVNNNKVAASIEPSLINGTTGLSTQILVGSFWNNSLPFYSRLVIVSPSNQQNINIDSNNLIQVVNLNQIQVVSNRLKISFNIGSICNSTYKMELFSKGLINKSIYSDTIQLNNGVFTLIWNNIKNGTYFVRLTKQKLCSMSGTVLYDTL